jgi:hypothetical protein
MRIRSRSFRLASIFCSVISAAIPASSPLYAQTIPVDPGSIESAVKSSIESALSTSGSFSIIPIDTWGSGDFEALSDTWFGDNTPRTNQTNISMDQTASTTYEGELFFKKLRLKVGLDVDVDNNFIGKLNRFMGYINYSGFTLRVQTSELRGTLAWTGSSIAGMPSETAFDNRYTSVDLLYYKQTGGIDYFGIGYTSYSLPVQLDCLIYDSERQEVWWAPTGAVYQPDMAFHVYSVLIGMDTLHEAFTRSGTMAGSQGFGLWAESQDRVGGGVSNISDEAKLWVEKANSGLSLWSSTQIAMLVDYDLTLGLQWVGNLGPVRLGFGIGYNLGGQMVLCVTPKGPVETGYVDASPSVYLIHYGPILKGTISY